jgi:hypothetical protein
MGTKPIMARQTIHLSMGFIIVAGCLFDLEILQFLTVEQSKPATSVPWLTPRRRICYCFD